MAYQRKTRDYYSIEQFTAEGWEEVTAEETRYSRTDRGRSSTASA